MSRLRHADRLTAAPVRYEACHPGALLHVDHKKLGRVPVGGGHRVLGRAARPHHSTARVGHDHFEVFVDDASRLAAVVQVPDERGPSAARALEIAVSELAAVGIRVERVLTDNGPNYRSRAFAATLERIGATHRWTRPYRPQTNGASEFGRPFAVVRRFDAAGGWLGLTVPHPVGGSRARRPAVRAGTPGAGRRIGPRPTLGAGVA